MSSRTPGLPHDKDPEDAARPVRGAAPPPASQAPTLAPPIPLPSPLPPECAPHAPGDDLVDARHPAPAGATWRRSFGRKGTHPGELAYPRALATAPDGSSYVVDKQGRLQKLDRDLKVVKLSRTPEVQNGKPTGLAIARDGGLIAADTHYARVLVYSPDLELRRAWGRPGSQDGGFLFLADAREGDDGLWYTLDYGDDIARVQVFDAKGGFIRRFGKFGVGPGEFQRPMALALDTKRKELVVADSVNHRVQVLDLATGGMKRQVGGLGDERGRLKYPYDVSIDDEGRLWVAEFGNHRLQVFDREGRSVGLWGKPGRAEGEVAFPWAVALTTPSRVLFLDSGNDRLYELDRQAVLDGRGS